jgi:hypothetical protein
MIPEAIQTIINRGQFDNVLRSRILSWDEPAFLKFLSLNVRKIASKLRAARTHEDQRDIGLELFVARILSIAGCHVSYEPKSKGPDFLVKHEEESFFCEVKRIREVLPPTVEKMRMVEFPAGQFKIVSDIICNALLQIVPGEANVIYIRSNRFTMQKADLLDAFTAILDQIFSADGSFLKRKGFTGPGNFKERAGSCSAIIFDDLWSNSDHAQTTGKVYVNSAASHKLSERSIVVLQSAIKIPFIRATRVGGT